MPPDAPLRQPAAPPIAKTPSAPPPAYAAPAPAPAPPAPVPAPAPEMDLLDQEPEQKFDIAALGDLKFEQPPMEAMPVAGGGGAANSGNLLDRLYENTPARQEQEARQQ